VLKQGRAGPGEDDVVHVEQKIGSVLAAT
jgi:hypothetical protein